MKIKDYQDLLDASEKQLVLIAFAAEWSGASQMLINMLDIAKGDLKNVVVGIIDVDEEEELVIDLGISKIPTTFIVSQRTVVDLFTGTVSRKNLVNRIRAVS